MTRHIKSLLMGGACAALLASAALAGDFNIPGGDLRSALDAYAAQTGVALIYPARDVIGVRTRGVNGDVAADVALSRILADTGFAMRRHPSGAIAIVRDSSAFKERQQSEITQPAQLRVAEAASASAAIESVVVTSSKIKGDIQTVPIAITALSQEQLTSRQIAGGPDLVKEVPNLTFSKTNFTGYNIEIRGIGTQAISVTTDPAVAVAFNDIPFIRNHFFEQEFYDVSQVEVLRGPQGTLYGRNATAGVVNVISAKPTDQFEAMASADIGNYHNRRYEGMINVPIVDDRLDIRVAGEWTKRDGYSFNEITNAPIDGRDLWSSRVSIGIKPVENVQATLVWEHFQENDDRLRSSKQLCHTDPTPSEIGGYQLGPTGGQNLGYFPLADHFSQGCRMSSLYTADAFQVPNGYSLPYYLGASAVGYINGAVDPYASATQSRDLRVIESTINPVYRAKNDIVEFNADYAVSPVLTLTSQTAYNHDFLYSTEDYNRFNTSPGVFSSHYNDPFADPRQLTIVSPDGVFCDPQLGCANRLVAEDRSDEHAWQLSQEFRLSSNFTGPLNFSFGGNYLHYETEENYYVFINALTLLAASPFGFHNFSAWNPATNDNHECLDQTYNGGFAGGFQYYNPLNGSGLLDCAYIDTNPVASANNEGHNYFLSQNPYVLNSYAGFGEAYYSITQDLKLTGGLRWTDDEKHFTEIPSEVLTQGYGYPSIGVENQKWNEWTGRFAANWTPKLDFTDQTLLYGSYARGYKAGGANPPGAVLLDKNSGNASLPSHPKTFAPEFIDAYELGTKNTLLDGALTLNGDVFYYNYKGYQISEIVDRTSINLNFNATVKGAELETSWEAAPGLKFSFAGGYETSRLANGSKAIDLIDRTAGHSDWVVVKPYPTEASNCLMPVPLLATLVTNIGGFCTAYVNHLDPITHLRYVFDPKICGNPDLGTTSPCDLGGYPGFDPLSVDPTAPADVNGGAGLPPNNGAGFDKDVSGNQLPNAPHFTTSLTAEYTLPVSQDWAATLHGDFYWQSQSYARVFNDRPYDKIRGYSNVNLALILTSADGWQVLGYLKNVFNTTAITGDFLNSDDTGLTTNVFLTDPRLFGVRVTKNF